jgi:hypothetical protein
MEIMSKREAVIEVVNRLFIFTDQQEWELLLKDVFAETVMFDMSSAGGEPAKRIKASEICSMWKDGFNGLDHIHHQAGNYLVTIREDVNAEVFCYAIATHFKKDAKNGNLREFVGSYDVMLTFTDQGWRINGFRYNLKYVHGNVTLE